MPETPAPARGPIVGQLAFEIQVECPECWAAAPVHMHYCSHAKTTERQRMMS